MNNINNRKETKEDYHNTEQIGRISEVERNTYTIRFFEKDIPGKIKGNFYEEDS